MRKLIIATHGKLAAGFAHTLGMLGAATEGLVSYGFYCDEEGVDDTTAERCVAELSPTDQLVVCTDIGFGSVNQAFMRAIAMHPEADVLLVSGVNLPLLLELSIRTEKLSKPDLSKMVADAAAQLSIVEIPCAHMPAAADAKEHDGCDEDCDEDFFA